MSGVRAVTRDDLPAVAELLARASSEARRRAARAAARAGALPPSVARRRAAVAAGGGRHRKDPGVPRRDPAPDATRRPGRARGHRGASHDPSRLPRLRRHAPVAALPRRITRIVAHGRRRLRDPRGVGAPRWLPGLRVRALMDTPASAGELDARTPRAAAGTRGGRRPTRRADRRRRPGARGGESLPPSGAGSRTSRGRRRRMALVHGPAVAPRAAGLLRRRVAALAERVGAPVARVAVYGNGDALRGFYLLAAPPGGIAHVMQMAAADEVIREILCDAFMRGCLAVRGRVDPRFTLDLTDRGALLHATPAGMLVHARDAALTRQVERGQGVARSAGRGVVAPALTRERRRGLRAFRKRRA